MGHVKKLILTGGNGYLGKEIQKELKKKKIKLINIFKKKKDLNINLLVNKNFFKLNSFDKDYTIIHCAGFVPTNLKEYQSNKNINNIKMLNNILKTRIKNIIFISSFSVYGNTKKENEKKILRKRFENKYLESKIKCENNLINSKKNFLILRLPGLFGGTKKKGLIYNYISSLIKNKKFKIKKKYPFWTCLHVEDAARGITEILLKKKINFNIYNLSYEKNFSAKDVIKIISKKFKKKINFKFNERLEISTKYKLNTIKNFELRIKEEIEKIKQQLKNDKIN